MTRSLFILCLLFSPFVVSSQVSVYKKSTNSKAKSIKNNRVVLYLLKSDSAGTLDGAPGTKKCRGVAYRKGILTGVSDSSVIIDSAAIPFNELSAIAHLKAGQKGTGKVIGCVGVMLMAFSYLEYQNFKTAEGEEESYPYYIPLFYAGAPMIFTGIAFLVISRTAVYDLNSEYYLKAGK